MSPASTLSFASRAQNVFVAPGTLAAMAQTAPPGAVLTARSGCSSRTKGGVFDSTGPSDAVVLELQIRTAGLGPVEITDEKQQTLEFADRQGENFSRLFGLIGSFIVVAGVLLLINTFVMLAEERKSELGTLRALGFTRRHLVSVFGFEGTAYSVVAAALRRVGRHRCRCVWWCAPPRASSLRVERGIVGLKFAVHTRRACSQASRSASRSRSSRVWGTSVRISRLNIIRAIRDTPDSAAADQRRASATRRCRCGLRRGDLRVRCRPS